MPSAAIRLKELRERANPRLTVRGIAEKLGIPWSTYTRYETPARYKKPYLPMPLARRIARILADHGIDQAEVMTLAVDDDDLIEQELSAAELQLLNRFRSLDADQRRLLAELAETMGNAATTPAPKKPTIHEREQGYRAGTHR